MTNEYVDLSASCLLGDYASYPTSWASHDYLEPYRSVNGSININMLLIDLPLWEEQNFEIFAYCDGCGFRHNYAYELCVRCGR